MRLRQRWGLWVFVGVLMSVGGTAAHAEDADVYMGRDGIRVRKQQRDGSGRYQDKNVTMDQDGIRVRKQYRDGSGAYGDKDVSLGADGIRVKRRGRDSDRYDEDADGSIGADGVRVRRLYDERRDAAEDNVRLRRQRERDHDVTINRDGRKTHVQSRDGALTYDDEYTYGNEPQPRRLRVRDAWDGRDTDVSIRGGSGTDVRVNTRDRPGYRDRDTTIRGSEGNWDIRY